MENSENNRANGILRNTIIAVSLKYLSNFGGSLKMSLINCKLEFKLKCTNYYVLVSNGNANSNNIILFIK